MVSNKELEPIFRKMNFECLMVNLPNLYETLQPTSSTIFTNQPQTVVFVDCRWLSPTTVLVNHRPLIFTQSSTTNFRLPFFPQMLLDILRPSLFDNCKWRNFGWLFFCGPLPQEKYWPPLTANGEPLVIVVLLLFIVNFRLLFIWQPFVG